MGATERKSVFVVGAGASQEFGLPTGAALMEQIRGLADVRFSDGYRQSHGEYEVVRTLRFMSDQKDMNGINDYLHAAWAIRDNMPLAPSIDNFLHSRRAEPIIVELGKVLIARAILKAEKSSKLYIDPAASNRTLAFEDLSETWASRLFKLMVAAGDSDSFISGLTNISFVSFNYDRCIEQFIVNASETYFPPTPDCRERVVEALEVLHPYGAVGSLTWGSQQTDKFGAEVVGEVLYKISQGIRTFTEGSVSEVQEAIAQRLSEAEVLVFLGFAYHPLNMELMKAKNSRFEIRNVFGTSKGLSEDSEGRIKHELRTNFNPLSGAGHVSLKDLKCFELFDYFNRFFLSM